MKNRYLEKFDNIIKIKVEGKNINNFIKRLIKRKINIIKLIPISYKEVHIILKYKDYKELIKYKSIYKISIISTHGKLKTKELLKKNSILLFSLLVGIIIIIILSNIIFSIEIIHEDKEIRKILKEELNKNEIKKYRFKKNHTKLEQIEDKILKNNKDKLEWIEIIESGTKYIIRIEERKINKTKKEYEYQNIISKKESIITDIYALSGEIQKEKNDYVKKGDIVIAGYITLPDNSKIPTVANGEVYGEVWYKVSIQYPYIYKEEKLTGKNKNIYVLNIINKRISLFDFKKYKSFKSKDKILLNNQLSNFKIIKEKQYELKVIDEVYPIDIAINKSKEYIEKKLKKDNPNIKEIKKIMILSKEEKETVIDIKMFITAIENIGEISKIDPNNLETKE